MNLLNTAEWRQKLGAWLHQPGFMDFELGAHGAVRLETVTLTRWVAVCGQLFTVLFVHFSLGIDLPLIPLVGAIAFSAAVNIWLASGRHATTRLTERAAALLFAYDIVQLTVMLELTGGLQNPFAILLLVPVALAAGTLGRNAVTFLTLLTQVAIAIIAFWPGELPWIDGGLRLPVLFLVAEWTSLSLATVLISGYTWRISEEARRQANALAATQLALAREREISALGAQAAAEAHLLGSPLATINVIAKDLVHEIPENDRHGEDVRELLTQVQRCRDILSELSKRGRDDHAPFIRAPLAALLETIAAEYARPEVTVGIEVEDVDGTADPSLILSPEMRHSFANLVDNAIQFARSEVLIQVRPEAGRLSVVIVDDGPGFPPEVLDRLGEPYFSTRHDHGGLGLGVFIAMSLLARTGAKLHFDNRSKGARVSIVWVPFAVERFNEGDYDDRSSS